MNCFLYKFQAQFTQVFALTNQENGIVGNPQIIGEEVPTFVGGIGNENEQQWATQHVTIIHQSPPEPSTEAHAPPEKNSSYLSWDVPNTESVSTAPMLISSQNNVIQEVSTEE